MPMPAPYVRGAAEAGTVGTGVDVAMPICVALLAVRVVQSFMTSLLGSAKKKRNGKELVTVNAHVKERAFVLIPPNLGDIPATSPIAQFIWSRHGLMDSRMGCILLHWHSKSVRTQPFSATALVRHPSEHFGSRACTSLSEMAAAAAAKSKHERRVGFIFASEWK